MQHADFSDSILLDSLRQGDEEAFNVLFYRYHDSIYRALLRLLNRTDEADDVLQDTFLRLYRQPPKMERAPQSTEHAPGSNGRAHNLGAWLYRVALNLGHNALRGERRRSDRQQRSLVAAGPPEDTPDPARLVLRNEEREIVRKVLGELKRDYQVSLVLRYEGLSYAEIGAVLGTATTNVGSILARAEKEFKVRYLHVVDKGGGQP